MSPAANTLCDLSTRIDSTSAWNPEDAEDAEVVAVLIHGLFWSQDMRALLHGIAAGVQARFGQQEEAAGGEERL